MYLRHSQLEGHVTKPGSLGIQNRFLAPGGGCVWSIWTLLHRGQLGHRRVLTIHLTNTDSHSTSTMQKQGGTQLSHSFSSLTHPLAEEKDVRKQTHPQLPTHSLGETEFALESLGQGGVCVSNLMPEGNSWEQEDRWVRGVEDETVSR